jgi:hypothetical protein
LPAADMTRRRRPDERLPTVLDLLFPGPYITKRLNQLERHVMTQLEDLQAAIAQVGVDLGEAATRIEAKLAEGNPDLSDEIATLRGYGETLDSIAADPVEPPPDPEPEPPVE